MDSDDLLRDLDPVNAEAMGEDYDGVDWLIDNETIELGRRYREALLLLREQQAIPNNSCTLKIDGDVYQQTLLSLCEHLAHENFGDVLGSEQQRQIIVSFFTEPPRI